MFLYSLLKEEHGAKETVWEKEAGDLKRIEDR